MNFQLIFNSIFQTLININNILSEFFYYIIQVVNILYYELNLNLLPIMLLLNILIIISIFFLSVDNAKKISLYGSLIMYLFSLLLLNEVLFSNSIFFKYKIEYYWLSFLDINLKFGVDGLSVLFIILTTFLTIICVLSSVAMFKKNINVKEYIISLFFIELLLILTFSSLNVLLFYVFFESVLIPMFFIIGIWGSRKRRIRASFFLLMYTILGSVFMLISIIYIYIKIGSFDIEYIYTMSHVFTIKEQFFLFLGFFLGFAVKIPMVPLHIWLPEAHVEAPTIGSIILAGLLLKLGSYGMIKYCIVLFPYGLYLIKSYINLFAILAIVYTSLTTLCQVDLKKIIAYSSIGHMNFVVLGIFSLNKYGIIGSIFLMISHGFVSSCLFFFIGCLYDRFKSRNIQEYSGICTIMPKYVSLLLIFIMANISFPGTSSFIAEFLILNGVYLNSNISVFAMLIGIILTTCYTIWMYNRLSFGIIKQKYLYTENLDLTYQELMVILLFLYFVLLFGLKPNILIAIMYDFVYNLKYMYIIS